MQRQTVFEDGADSWNPALAAPQLSAPDGPTTRTLTHRRRHVFFLSLAVLLFPAGCGGPSNTVEYPENPAPPPSVDALRVPDDSQEQGAFDGSQLDR